MAKIKFLLIHSPAYFRDKKGEINSSDIHLMPVGLIAIANKLKENGVAVQVLHLGLEFILDPKFKIEDHVKSNNFCIVGISIQWAKQIYSSLKLARKIKINNRNAFILLGGFTASYFADEIMRKCNFIDGIIRGDGELPALSLSRQLGRSIPKIELVPNLLWRKDHTIIDNPVSYVATEDDINNLDYVNLTTLKNYKTYLSMDNQVRIKPFIVAPGRGCPFICPCCGGSKTAQKKICRRSRFILQKPEKVFDTILKAKCLGWDTIYFPIDSISRSDYYPKVFKLIRDNKLDLSVIFNSWSLPSKIFINDLLKTFNNVWVEISPECFSERVRLINKDKKLFYKNKRLESMIDYMVRKRIYVVLFFGYFLPFETFNDILDTLSFVLELHDKYGDRICLVYDRYSTDPGSEIFVDPKKYDLVLKSKTLSDYIRHINKYNQLFITGDMLLHRPRYFSPKQASDIDHLIQFVRFFKRLNKSKLIIKRFMGGSYQKAIKMIYNWLIHNEVKAHQITANKFKHMLHNFINCQKDIPGNIHALIDYEYEAEIASRKIIV